MKALLMGAAIAALAGTAHAVPGPFLEPRDAESCKVQALPWCSPTQPSAGSLGDIKTVQAIEAQVRQHWSYGDPSKGLGPWRSHLNEITAAWRGNCVDVTLTELQMIANAGWDTSKEWRVIVSTPDMQNGLTNQSHMIGMVKDSSGTVWVVGDVNYKAPYKWSDRKLAYKILYDSQVSEGLVWHYYGDGTI